MHRHLNVYFSLHYLIYFAFNNVNLYFTTEQQGKETQTVFFDAESHSFKI